MTVIKLELFMVNEGVEDAEILGEALATEEDDNDDDNLVVEGMAGKIFLELTELLYCC